MSEGGSGRFLGSAKRVLGPLLVLVAAVFLGRALFVGWDEVRGYPWRFDAPYLALSVALIFAYYVQQWGGWRLIMRGFDDPLGGGESAAIWFASILGRYVPGNVAMVAGRIVLCKRRGIPTRDTVTSMIYENALILIGALLVAAASVPLWPPFEYRPYALVLALLAPLGLALLHPTLFAKLTGVLLRRLGREPLAKTLPFGRVLALLLYYVGGWVLLGLAFSALAASVAPVGFVEVALLVGGYAFAWEVGFLSLVTPSGLGVKEGILVFVLSLVFPVPVAAALAVLSRLWQTLAEVISAGVVWALFKVKVAPEKSV